MRVIDSHTGGEPTRLIIEGGPELGSGSMAERRKIFAENFDHMRRFAVNEPRSFDAMVGALLCEPSDKGCVAGLIFFNNVGYLGMCGHGIIGAAVTLAYMGRIGLGTHKFETPVGIVTVNLLAPNVVQIENIASYRYHHAVALDVPGLGKIVGDVAWGGNWFFLTESVKADLSLSSVNELTQKAELIRAALITAGISGKDGAEIDHIEFFGAPHNSTANSRNFVLCPGGQYDRSPCGTGTSAKLACLAASGKLAENTDWIQESILGSTFTGSYYRDVTGAVIPRITGTAFVVAETRLVQQANDPFAFGIS